MKRRGAVNRRTATRSGGVGRRDGVVVGRAIGHRLVRVAAACDARRLELKTYVIANPSFYRYYRLNVTANNGDVVFTDLGEFGLLVSKP